ncbi:MAG: hypothetical protein ACRDWV_04085 [Acidimicrobiales bacterium]
MPGAIVAAVAVGAAAFFVTRHFDHQDTTRAAANSRAAPTAKSTTATLPPVTTPSTTASAAATSSLTRHQVANRISAMLATSALDRQTVVAAAAELQSCSNPPGAREQFDALASRRQQLLTELQTLDVTPLKRGGVVKQDLQAAWSASLGADHAYATWASEVIGDCTPGYDPNAADVNSYNRAATQAKTAFVAAWNPVAARYSLPRVTQTSI